MTPEKTLDRIEKLLRLTKLDSGATEAEQVSAALEVCRLLNEKKAAPDSASQPASRSRPRQRPYWAGPDDDDTATYGNDAYGTYSGYAAYEDGPRTTRYNLITILAPYLTSCGVCEGSILPGQSVWQKTGADTFQFIHTKCL